MTREQPVTITRGHDAARAQLHVLLSTPVPPHALLLVGPPGVGVGTLAREAAAALLCLAPVAGAACGDCRSCRLIASGNHADLALLGSSAPAGIDEIRTLTGSLALTPVEGGRRVALIERAAALTEPAQHALLKLLEEPPARTHLLLAASDERALLPTIRSRCALLRLGLPAHDAAVALLVERLSVTADVAARLLSITGGRPGPLLAAGAGEGTAQAHGALQAALFELLAVAPHRRLARLPELVAAAAALLAVTDGTPAATTPTPADRRRAASALLTTWHRLASDLARSAAGVPSPTHLPVAGDRIAAIAAALPRAQWAALLATSGATATALRASGNPELLLDALALRWPYQTPLR